MPDRRMALEKEDRLDILEPVMEKAGRDLAAELSKEMDFEQTLKELLGGKIDYAAFVDKLMVAYDRDLPDGVDSELRNGEQTLDQQMRFAALRRAALTGAAGAAEAITGDSEAQYKRIMEAYVVQLGTRQNDIRVWIDSVARKQQAER